VLLTRDASRAAFTAFFLPSTTGGLHGELRAGVAPARVIKTAGGRRFNGSTV
jgi:hypothetical protein